jgi:hypothetical protein
MIEDEQETDSRLHHECEMTGIENMPYLEHHH